MVPLLNGNVITGFLPAPGTGRTTAAPGLAGGETPSMPEFLSALLDAGTKPAIEAATSAFHKAVAPMQQALSSAAATIAVTAAPTTEADLPSEKGPDPDDLMAGLIDALAVLADSVDAGRTASPALEDRIEDLIDRLADLLGLPPPGGTATPADAAESGEDPLDPLAAIAAAATRLAAAARAPSGNADAGSIAAAPSPIQETIAGMAGALPEAARHLLDALNPSAQPNAMGQQASESPAITPAESVDIPELVGKLADRLAALAQDLKPTTPHLAERLAALADRLQSGNLDAATLEKLGLAASGEAPDTEVELAIQRLLAPPAETASGTPARPFTAASLALPPLTTPANGEKPAPPATPAKVDETRADTRPGVGKPADTPAPEPRPAAERVTGTEPKIALAAQDPAQPQQPAPAHAAVPTPTTAAAPADIRTTETAYRQGQQINIPQIAFEVVRQVQAGNSRFQIRLDPPELGRIDVQLDVDKAGNVNARMTVERAETLDLMQRDQRALERALAQAGLDAGKTNLEFSLRQNPFARDEQQFQRQQGGGFAGHAPDGDAGEAPHPLPQISAYRGLAAPGGVNIFV